MVKLRSASLPRASENSIAPTGAEPREGEHGPSAQQPEGQEQQGARNSPSTPWLSRKGRFLAAGLLAAARSNPGVAVDLAVLSEATSGLRALKYPRRSQVSVLPLGQNPRPEGIELLVADLNSYRGGHGDWTSYVANSHTDKTQDIETLLLENGLSAKGCETFEELILISKMENPPEVISMSFGASPASDFRDRAPEVLRKHLAKERKEQWEWSARTLAAYKKDLKALAKLVQKDFNSHATRCVDGTRYVKKRAQAFNALTRAGVTVVLAAGNDGLADAIMKEVGMDSTQGIFRSSFYSNGEFLPDGVIVVGGSQKFSDGSFYAVSKSNPNPAVDVLADYHNVRVSWLGTTQSGTSLSAPKVAAVAANILAINPQLQPADVERIILSTATPINDPSGRTRSGVVNPTKALEAAKESLSTAI